MVWTNPPTEVTAFRDAMIATTTIGTTIGVSSGNVHYPYADPTTATLPAIVIDTADLEGRRADVGGSMLAGKFEATILFADSVDLGTIEQYRYAIARELVEWTSESLAIERVRLSRCLLPTPGQQAGGDSGQAETGKAYRGLVIEAWFDG